ncbi:unnamed protein product, partial [Prorocentrum cordatum]
HICPNFFAPPPFSWTPCWVTQRGGARGPALNQPNPPAWPRSVRVFGPEDSAADIRSAVDEAYRVNGGEGNNGEFSQHRFAFLFRPGEYDVEVPVGYYTQVAGLGRSPEDVVFSSEKGVYCEEGSYNQDRGALTTFWRVAENFKSDATNNWFGELRGMLWATSQAAPLRRLVVSGDLILFQYKDGEAAGYASGGFLANSNLLGHVAYGSQQQYFTRNSALSSADGGVWNMVFVGTTGAPGTACGAGDEGSQVQHVVEVGEAPKVAEKPFVFIGADGKYGLAVPEVKAARVGFDWDEGAREVPFERVFVADPERDTADTINARLAEGLDVVLAPGVYQLDAPLRLQTANQVLLGLGLATLVAMRGAPAVRVGDVGGVRVAGVLLQAGPERSDSLLEWGSRGFPGDAGNPGFLHDVFARVGGPAEPSEQRASTMIRINAGNVIGDNLWLWRADHTEAGEVKGGAHPCEVALCVEGDDVTMYGLAAEHTLGDQVRWSGDRGATYFFQSELPYDVAEAYGEMGYAGYRVSNNVTEHRAFGAGVYHYFRDFPVTVHAGIVAPAHVMASIVSPVAVFLNGRGTMRHVVDNLGADTSETASGGIAQWLCPADAEGKAVSVPADPGGPSHRSTPLGPAPAPRPAPRGGAAPKPTSARGGGGAAPRPAAAPASAPAWLRSRSKGGGKAALGPAESGSGIDWDLGKIYLAACIVGALLGVLCIPAFDRLRSAGANGAAAESAADASGAPARAASWLEVDRSGAPASARRLLDLERAAGAKGARSPRAGSTASWLAPL